MSTNGDAPGEAGARDAGSFAWDVPGDAHIVALVHESDDAERSATVVDAIATAIARKREHTLLLSAEPGPSPLDELLGGGDSEGLPAALGGRARLTDVAVQRVDRPFVYLPAGHDPAAIRALLDDDVLVSFVDRVRERGGTLFVVASERALLSEGLRRLLDGYVALGDAEVPADAEGLIAFGRVRFDDSGEPALAAGENGLGDEPTIAPGGAEKVGVAEETSTAEEVTSHEPAEPVPDASPAFALDTEPSAPNWARGAMRPSAEESETAPSELTPRLVGVGVGIAVALLAAWWWFSGSSSGASTDLGPTNVALAEAAIEAGPPPLDPADAARVFATAPELPFSVLIASYAANADADADLTTLRARGLDAAGVFFISPTPVRGVLYHRLFAGALANEGEAVALMELLVASGAKDQASAWDVRPARRAFDLGVFVDRAAAEARVSALDGMGVPSYIVSTPLDDRDAFQVYGGAYENERASLPMAELLGAAGEPASLIARQGGAAPSSSTP